MTRYIISLRYTAYIFTEAQALTMERDDLEYSLEQEVRELRAIYASRRIMNNFHKASRHNIEIFKRFDAGT